MSTHVVGFRPPDEKWRRMKAVWDACLQAEIEPPENVNDFFEGRTPDPAGVEVSLTGFTPIAREWMDETRSGYEINVDDLPDGVKIVRFYNSW